MSSASRYHAGSSLMEVASPLSRPRSKTLSRVGGIAAILVAALLITGLLGPAIPLPGLGIRNWLVVLFQINAGAGQLPAEPLRVFNPLDVIVLVLVGLAFASFWPKAGTVDRILVVIAAGLPFVGIALLVVTHQTGRSSVMSAGLAIAVLMLRNHMLARTVVYLGVLANGLLLVGDFATGTSAKPPIAALLALGYILLTIWFAAVGVRLLRFGPGRLSSTDTSAPRPRQKPAQGGGTHSPTHDKEATSMRVEGDVVIERPLEEVFDFVADECNEPQYNPRMTRAEKVSSGQIGVGTRFRSVMTGMGGAPEINIEFTEFDRPRRITEKVQLSTMDIKGALFFEPVPGGTRMKWIWDLEPHGFYKLMSPLIRRVGERQERTIWTSLKHLLEAQPRPSQPGAISPAGRGPINEASNRPQVFQ